MTLTIVKNIKNPVTGQIGLVDLPALAGSLKGIRDKKECPAVCSALYKLNSRKAEANVTSLGSIIFLDIDAKANPQAHLDVIADYLKGIEEVAFLQSSWSGGLHIGFLAQYANIYEYRQLFESLANRIEKHFNVVVDRQVCSPYNYVFISPNEVYINENATVITTSILTRKSASTEKVEVKAARSSEVKKSVKKVSKSKTPKIVGTYKIGNYLVEARADDRVWLGKKIPVGRRNRTLGLLSLKLLARYKGDFDKALNTLLYINKRHTEEPLTEKEVKDILKANQKRFNDDPKSVIKVVGYRYTKFVGYGSADRKEAQMAYYQARRMEIGLKIIDFLAQAKEKMSVAEIAKALGMSRQTFYNHLKRSRTLMQKYMEYIERFAEKVVEEVKRVSKGIVKKATEIINGVCAEFTKGYSVLPMQIIHSEQIQI